MCYVFVKVCFYLRACICVYDSSLRGQNVCDCLVSRRKIFSVFSVMIGTHCID